jgi:hypothetical protein
MKLETKFLPLYAVSAATLIAIGQTPKRIGLGLTLLAIGAIYAFTLQRAARAAFLILLPFHIRQSSPANKQTKPKRKSMQAKRPLKRAL